MKAAVEIYVGLDGHTYVRVARFDWRIHQEAQAFFTRGRR